MSRAVVVIPWWPGTVSAWRYRWRDQIVALWVKSGYEVVLGLGFEGAARNEGVERAIKEHDPEVIVCTDADALVIRDSIAQAVEMAAKVPGLVVPHDRYVYLGEQACMGLNAELALEILEGNDGRWPITEDATHGLIESQGLLSVGGPTVFSAETFRQAGGYDERLVRAYDGAFALACSTLVGPQRRIEGDFLHLYHERPSEEPGETWEVIRDYHRAAEAGMGAMAELVRSRRELRSRGGVT